MKLIQGGVSKKTGEPYDAFWACSSGERHKQSMNGHKPSYNAPQGSPRPAQPQGDVDYRNEIMLKLDEVLMTVKLILDRLDAELGKE